LGKTNDFGFLYSESNRWNWIQNHHTVILISNQSNAVEEMQWQCYYQFSFRRFLDFLMKNLMILIFLDGLISIEY
jgi:hypothetical protein